MRARADAMLREFSVSCTPSARDASAMLTLSLMKSSALPFVTSRSRCASASCMASGRSFSRICTRFTPLSTACATASTSASGPPARFLSVTSATMGRGRLEGEALFTR